MLHLLPANWWVLKWGCLDSNQGPLPYQRQKRVSWMFAFVQEVLHIGAFSFYGCRVRSLLFRRIVVRLSSIVVGFAPHVEAIQ
jgi:hypothetical protein